MSDCGRDSQCTSRRSEPKPLLSMRKPTSACFVRRSSLMWVILPGADARDLQVAALDEPERVVELDPVRVSSRRGRART